MIILVAIGGASLLWWQKRRRSARRIQAHGRQGRGDRSLLSKIGRRAKFFGTGKYSSKPKDVISNSALAHKLDADEPPPTQQIPEPVLILESTGPPKWLPELPSHQEINLQNPVATAPPPPSSRRSGAQPNLTLQRLHQNLAAQGVDSPLSLPPRALFTRQSTMSSNYAESMMSSAPSSRPSTIVYPSPLRPRPVTRNAAK